MQTICTSLQTDNHINTSSVNFFTNRVLFLTLKQQCESTKGIKKYDLRLEFIPSRRKTNYKKQHKGSKRYTESSGRLKSSKSSSCFVIVDSILDTDIAILSVLLNNHIPKSTASDITSTLHNQQHTHTQPFNGFCPGQPGVGRYQKKHSPTHTQPDH